MLSLVIHDNLGSVNVLDRIIADIAALRADQDASAAKSQATAQSCSDKLDQILAILTEPAPVDGAEITFAKEQNDMGKALHHGARGKMKFVLNDNGTATGTISFIDSVGAPTAPVAGATISTTATSSDPGVTTSVDATGLLVTAAPASPLPNPLPQGVVISASVTITNPDATVLGPFTCDNSADPLNVTAGGPAGAHIVYA